MAAGQGRGFPDTLALLPIPADTPPSRAMFHCTASALLPSPLGREGELPTATPPLACGHPLPELGEGNCSLELRYLVAPKLPSPRLFKLLRGGGGGGVLLLFVLPVTISEEPGGNRSATWGSHFLLILNFQDTREKNKNMDYKSLYDFSFSLNLSEFQNMKK